MNRSILSVFTIVFTICITLLYPFVVWWGNGQIAPSWLVDVLLSLKLPLKLYPVLVNIVLLATFAYTLFFPPSAIEIFARKSEPDLPLIAVAYTRRITQIWCVFFIINGSIAFATAIWAPEVIWSLYTGVISYLLMGILLGGEFFYRKRFKRLNHVGQT